MVKVSSLWIALADVQKYPDHVPLLSLTEPTKLNAGHMRTLTKLVQDKAKSLVGAPMIFDVS